MVLVGRTLIFKSKVHGSNPSCSRLHNLYTNYRILDERQQMENKENRWNLTEDPESQFWESLSVYKKIRIGEDVRKRNPLRRNKEDRVFVLKQNNWPSDLIGGT